MDGHGVMHNEWSAGQAEGEEDTGEDQSVNYRDLSKVGNSWMYFEGIFRKDTKNGIGKWYFCNGDVFTGEFYEDRVNGRGMYVGGGKET